VPAAWLEVGYFDWISRVDGRTLDVLGLRTARVGVEFYDSLFGATRPQVACLRFSGAYEFCDAKALWTITCVGTFSPVFFLNKLDLT
jgi:hypothetical protein